MLDGDVTPEQATSWPTPQPDTPQPKYAREAAAPGSPEVSEVAHPFVAASAIEMRPTSWWWRGFVPSGMLTLLAGDGGVGKSTLAHEWVAHVTNGTAPAGGPGYGRPRGAVVITNEEAVAATVVPRLQALGADLDRVRLLDDLDPDTPDAITFPSGADVLRLAAREVDAGLVVVDSMRDAFDSGLDPARPDAIAEVLRCLRVLADECDLAVVGLHHLTKRPIPGEAARDRVTGSRAWTDKPRMVLMMSTPHGLSTDDTDERRLGPVKSNVSRGGIVVGLRMVEHPSPLPGHEPIPGVEIGERVAGSMTDHITPPDKGTPSLSGKAADTLAAELDRRVPPAMLRADCERLLAREGYSTNAIREALADPRIETGQPSGFSRAGVVRRTGDPWPEPCAAPNCNRPAERGKPCRECLDGQGPHLRMAE